jgi:hypothetical protein
MRTQRSFVANMLFCLLCFSCGKQDQGHSNENEKVPAKNASKISHPKEPEVSSVGGSSATLEASLRKTLDSRGLGSNQVQTFRYELIELAKVQGVDPMSIAAPMILDDQSLDGQVKRMLWVLTAFQDPVMQAGLAKQLPAGKIRTLVVSSSIGQFEKQQDTAGMKSAYDSLPVGSDRTTFSGSLSKLIIRKEGLVRGLDFISQLEMPEERYAAIFATVDEWEAQVQDPAIRAKLDQVLNTMEGDLKESVDRLISSSKKQ